MNHKRNLRKAMLVLILILGSAYYFYWGNNAIETTHFDYTNEKIPDSFDGYTIVQVSDLHNMDFHGELIPKIEKADPDIIVVTGDLIDRNRTDLAVAEDFLEEAMAIAPVYFVSGNHEVASGKYNELQEIVDQTGVTNLDNDSLVLTQDNDQINLLGLADPLTLQLDEVIEEGSEAGVIKNTIEDISTDDPNQFDLLLSHRPELFDVYKDTGIDLVLTGHAHGGQIRLPFIGGLYAPTQGFLPEYTNGKYIEDQTTMILSRGLGNSIFPLRVFNRPELVVVTLESD
ncbi:metallophosphoesterase [Alkalibacterium putridalgicola]|uniref:metallophosphoesterase n=1 Tax=Alkalibacterium putridalgicola TaxID=426703 RepID=UPI0034CD0271